MWDFPHPLRPPIDLPAELARVTFGTDCRIVPAKLASRVQWEEKAGFISSDNRLRLVSGSQGCRWPTPTSAC